MAHVALRSPSYNPSACSAPSAAPSLGALAATVPLLAHPTLPVAYAHDDDRVYLRAGESAEVLARALWAFLRDVGGFRGDDTERAASLVPAARERLAAL